MNAKVEKLPKSTIKLTVTVPSAKVKEAYEKELNELVKKTELPGFRKGFAPKDLVKEKINVSKLYGEVINTLLQTYYPQALKENHIQSVANPLVEIKEFDIDKDFEFTAMVAIRPDVKIGDFRPSLKKFYENKINKAKEENAKRLREGQKLEDMHIHLTSNEVIEQITQASQMEFSDFLIEDEADRMMSKLVDQAQSIGLSLDQYLKSQNKTAEQLRADYLKTAEKSLKAEFALSKLVEDEKIEATDQEVTEAMKAAGDTRTPEQLNNSIEKWYIKSIIQKNKLIFKLIDEVEGPNAHHHEGE